MNPRLRNDKRLNPQAPAMETASLRWKWKGWNG